jgi:hypothetical protein
MNEDESTKLLHHLRREGVQTLISTVAVAVLVPAILVEHARGGELVDCEPQPVSGDGRHWAYRIIIDGRECWYPNERVSQWTSSAGGPLCTSTVRRVETV